MAFSDQGITIVYGDNGSGKSGYCRVLKHACRTRDSKFEIHPNIDETDETPQSADIHYRVGATSASFTWSPDAEQVPPLEQVSIFDARIANTHVQAENNVAYTPFPMRVLERLGDLCDVLKDRLETRIGQIQERTPLAISNHQLSDGTAAGKFLNGLTARSDLSTLHLLCDLKSDERRKLETLRTDLSQDPQKLISALKAQKQRVDVIIDQVRALSTSLSAVRFGMLTRVLPPRVQVTDIAGNDPLLLWCWHRLSVPFLTQGLSSNDTCTASGSAAPRMEQEAL